LCFYFYCYFILPHLSKINYHKQYVRAPRKIPETYAKKQLPAMSKQTMSKELFNFLQGSLRDIVLHQIRCQ